MDKKTILVVDDDNDYRKAISSLLTDLGFDVLEAKSGNEAFATFNKKPVDGIISDIRMPNGDGVNLLEKVRTKNQFVMFCLVSGNTDQGVASLIEKGANKVFPKPLVFQELKAYIVDRFNIAIAV
jgi:DNA-binding response OmpR family regulator